MSEVIDTKRRQELSQADLQCRRVIVFDPGALELDEARTPRAALERSVLPLDLRENPPAILRPIDGNDVEVVLVEVPVSLVVGAFGLGLDVELPVYLKAVSDLRGGRGPSNKR